MLAVTVKGKIIVGTKHFAASVFNVKTLQTETTFIFKYIFVFATIVTT